MNQFRVEDKSDRLVLNELTIHDVVNVGRFGTTVQLPEGDRSRARLLKAYERIQMAVENNEVVYGVNTGFGGMSGVQIDKECTSQLQENLIWFLKAGAGNLLPAEDVRGAMLLRVRSFLVGASAVRWNILQRYVDFLNKGITPCVREFGSIGASGDLIPLANIAGAVIGLNNEFRVRHEENEGEVVRGAVDVLEEYRLQPIRLKPKEGLAMVNGTSMSTAMAATCLNDGCVLFSAVLGAHGLLIQALKGMDESYEEFIHEVKPHPGQRWTAKRMRELLYDSKYISKTRSGTHQKFTEDEVLLRTLSRNPEARKWVIELQSELRGTKFKEVTKQGTRLLLQIGEAVRNDNQLGVLDVEPIQDRYSMRCLPQFIGPIRDGLLTLIRQVETEINSANDNPLVDELGNIYHGGNFLGQYTSIAMDQLRYYIGLLAKHLDSQIALAVSPEFSEGLPPSLVGNMDLRINMGLKGLQICGNSIMPLLTYYGNPIADRFPTHAEQFNQNINSQSFGSAYLARQSINAFRQYVAVALMFGVQATDLRAHIASGYKTFDPRGSLSSETKNLYEAILKVDGTVPTHKRPYVLDDSERGLDGRIERIATDLAKGQRGLIGKAIANTLATFQEKID